MPSEGERFNVDHVLNNICIFIPLQSRVVRLDWTMFTLYDVWSHGLMMEC